MRKSTAPTWRLPVIAGVVLLAVSGLRSSGQARIGVAHHAVAEGDIAGVDRRTLAAHEAKRSGNVHGAVSLQPA